MYKCLFHFSLVLCMCISCENKNEIKQIKINYDLPVEQIIEFSASFDLDDESLNDDMDHVFKSFENNILTIINDSSETVEHYLEREYDTDKGYWIVAYKDNRNKNTLHKRENDEIKLNAKIRFEKRILIRFEDLNKKAIKYPNQVANHVKKIILNRTGYIESDRLLTKFSSDGNVVKKYRQRIKHIEKNSIITLTLSDIQNMWILTGLGSKYIEYETFINDSIYPIENKRVTVVYNNVKIKNGGINSGDRRNVFGRSIHAEIISGTILRSISINNYNYIIRNEYFNCLLENEKKRLTTIILKENQIISTLSSYCLDRLL